ncbi:hypothetical protein PCC7418_1939 [Halothece sp. PCC 7418]|uniref:hypothetical protein n=1 Tax=Halothece sp. (strain PCC 7418) TaxID=65093 RepID=UPI0002A08109|nr:hypothetical protein [Halothece sp. PCC 7418]AFZ44107.1 hypothetical protein PCC7418_1939 [Halothece sp. PCC 7418]
MVGIIKNLFGGKDNYYAELDEDQEPAASASQQTQQSQPEPSPQKTEQPKAEATATQSQSAPAPSVPSQPTPVPQSQTTEKDLLTGETFAPTYLIPKPTIPRRRPGVNMGQFMDMARDMKTPRNQ